MTARGLLTSVLRWMALRQRQPDVPRQSGAIPYTTSEGEVFFLIITSRRSRRWIFPKGDPMEGKTPWEAAAQEAFEEAGVRGEIDPVSIGAYRTTKTSATHAAEVDVEMYALRVTRLLDTWPEKSARERHWVTLAEAEKRLSDPQLVTLAARVSSRVAGELANADRTR